MRGCILILIMAPHYPTPFADYWPTCRNDDKLWTSPLAYLKHPARLEYQWNRRPPFSKTAAQKRQLANSIVRKRLGHHDYFCFARLDAKHVLYGLGAFNGLSTMVLVVYGSFTRLVWLFSNGLPFEWCWNWPSSTTGNVDWLFQWILVRGKNDAEKRLTPF